MCARLLDVFFDVDAAVLESVFGLLLGGLEARQQADVVAGHAHAAAAAAGRRLDEDRVAHLVGQLQGLGVGVDQPFAAGHDGHAGFLGEFAGFVFVAQEPHRLLWRADELDVAGPADLGEVRVFRKKAVTGMNRLDVGDLGGADDPWDLEIALGRRGGADADGLVGEVEVRSAAVGLAVDGHDLDAEIPAGADHPQGDFATVRNQDALKHKKSECDIRCVCPP